jgi:hypothetical protein
LHAWIGESINLVTIRDTAGFGAQGWSYTWWSSQNGTSGNTTVVIPDTGAVYAALIATSQYGCVGDSTNITLLAQDNIVPPVGLTSISANAEVTHPTNGWTNYYFNNNTPANKSDDILLLSLKKNGNAIGTVGNGTFSVSNTATAGAGSNTGIQITNPLMSNSTNYYVMHRYWQVTATAQPTSSVGVRFYYNTQDYNDANGSFGGVKTMQQLVFYHLLNGNPNPATNWSSATLPPVSILHGATPNDTVWTYTNLGSNHHRAEFTVSSFSGGGGGFTGNNGPLPVQLLSFTAKANKANAVLNWQTSREYNLRGFDIERSADGSSYTKVGEVPSKGTSEVNLYHYVDQDAASVGKLLHYRLKLVEKSGVSSYSASEMVKFNDNFRQIAVVPNPAKDKVMVKGISDFTHLRLIDISGKVVLEQRIHQDNEELFLTNLAAGTYTIQLIGESGTDAIKLIKE